MKSNLYASESNSTAGSDEAGLSLFGSTVGRLAKEDA